MADMKQLVICEKPSVARDVARALSTTGERFTRTDWGFESASWLVTAARGHLVAEVDPDVYDPKYKQWVFDDLPIIPPAVLYKPRNADAAHLLRVLKSLMERNDVSGVVNSADAGREGEAIFALIYQYAKCSKPVQRAWFSSMTDDAIVDAFTHLRPGADFKPLEAAARCRAEADWLVGINATRAATVHLGRRELLSLGRVQTPTLALVARRDADIDAFVPTDFYQVVLTTTAAGGTFTATWFDDTTGDRFSDWLDADTVAQRCDRQPVTLTDLTTKEEQSRAPKLFDLTTLQQEANRRYGFSASRTLAAAQACYETHKVLTYPRTDSQWLTTDMLPTIPSVLHHVAAADPALATVASTLAGDTAAPWSRLANNAKVSDHHAIIPTDAPHDLTALGDDERRIYDLAARRFLAAMLPPARFLRTEAIVTVDTTNDRFRARGTQTVDMAWKAIYPGPGIGVAPVDDPADSDGDAADDDTRTLPPLTEGEPLTNDEVTVTTGRTKPPAHFTDATLLGAMATAGRLVDDDELAEAMKESGLGTPATRAAILDRLIAVRYLERKGKTVRATKKGRAVIDVLGDHDLTSPVLTGGWEKRLRDMEQATPGTEGRLRQAFLADVRTFTTSVVSWIGGLDASGFSTAEVLGPCPVAGCGGQIVERSKSWSCDSWKSKEEPGCGFAIWKERSGKKLTRAQAEKALADAPSTPPVRTERVVLGPCPTDGCSGSILERMKSWSCDSWRSAKEPGCGYVIWKTEKDGTVVTSEQAAAMLNAGESNARPAPTALRPCPMPRCKGSIVERDRAFSCTSWSPRSKGCGLTVWKTDKSGNVIATVDNLDELLPAAVDYAQSRKGSRKKSSRT